MKNKILNRTVLMLSTAVLLSAPMQPRAWDQLAPIVFNSHQTITYDAVTEANKQLRSARLDELNQWSKKLYTRLTPRVGLDNAPMSATELNGGFYPERHLDDATIRTINRLEQGNTVADKSAYFSKWHAPFLFNAYCGFFKELPGWATDTESCKALPLIGPGMPLHFNREYLETGGKPELKSANESCRDAVSAIRVLTDKAFSYWQKSIKTNNKLKAMRNLELMYFFNGIAVHAIEDSFAPAHVQRSAVNPRNIEDLCYYYDNNILPPSEAKACAHGVGDGNEPRDSVHFTGDEKYPGNAVPKALATQASAAYLSGFANLALNELKGEKADLDVFLNDFLITGKDSGKGYLDCETIK